MLNLADINNMFPKSHDGSVYSDLYKDCYGSRPRHCSWATLEDFQKDFDHLAEVVLPREMEIEYARKVSAQARFENLVKDVVNSVLNSTREDALRHIAVAEDIQNELEWYGYEHMEYHFGLGFGYIQKTKGN